MQDKCMFRVAEDDMESPYKIVPGIFIFINLVIYKL